jgi:hypothetical protein
MRALQLLQADLEEVQQPVTTQNDDIVVDPHCM